MNGKRARTKSTRKPKSKKTNKSSIPQSVKRYVSTIVSRNVETKVADQITADNVAVLPYGMQTTHTFTTLNLNQIFQGVTQGTGKGQRIGDEIKVKDLKFQGFINWDSSKLNDELYSHIPMYVKMFVFRRQNSLDNPATWTGPDGVGETTILMDGNNATFPINRLTDFNTKFNRDTYRIFKTKTFKLGPSAVGSTPTASGQWNNDFKFSQRFSIDLSKHVNLVKYSEGQNYQQNCAFYVGFMIAAGNNSTITNTAKPPIEIHYNVNMTYEDA